MDAATLLREARAAAGLSQAELAERSGTSQATLSSYEHGHRTPSAATLGRILAAAGRRLTAVPATRPVRSPGAAALDRAGRTLVEVLELASRLPTSHAVAELFPGLPRTRDAGGSG
jgi:transcriptional regulator with XRE-family HTH domain